MSKNRLRNNTESNRIENRPSAPSAQPVASPRAQPALLPRACLALPRAPRSPARPRACRQLLARPARPTRRYRAPAARVRCAPRSLAHVYTPAPARPYCLHDCPARPARALRAQPRAQRLPSAHALCHNTTLLYCDRIWPSLSCNTPQPTKLYCNTIS